MMPYKCTLTSENLVIALNRIRDLYRKLTRFKDKDYALHFIEQIYELFCQGIFIDQDIDIQWKNVEKNMNLDKSSSTLIHIIKQIRDEYVRGIVNGSERIDKYIQAINPKTLDSDCKNITARFRDYNEEIAGMLMNTILFCKYEDTRYIEGDCEESNKRELGFELNFDLIPLKRKEE